MLGWYGTIRRKQRRQFDRFLEHDNPRVRVYAEWLLDLDAERRRELREAREADEAFYEQEHDPAEEDTGRSPEEALGEISDLPF